MWIKLLPKLLLLVCVTSLLSEFIQAVDIDDEVDDGLDDDAAVVDEPEQEAVKPKEKVEYKTPTASGSNHFFETFDDQKTFSKRWVFSQAKKDGADADISKYDGKFVVEEVSDNALAGDLGLILSSKAKHHAIGAKLTKPFEFTSETIVIQYDVRFTSGQDCGGAYIKLLSHDPKFSLTQTTDKSPYTIMFGPDKCGNDNKLHFIFRHKNPITGKYEEKHAKKPSGTFDFIFTDKKSHLLTLVVNADSTFQIYVDQTVVNSGSLLQDMTPAVNPPKEIVDPNDKKPSDWDDREKVADPDATKPDDWDEKAPKQTVDEAAIKPEGWLDSEPELIHDPEAEKPEDWDDEMDGEWEAPQINNPKCKEADGCGVWKRPLIDNPNYKGKWKASMIDNPDYQGKWSPRMTENPEFFEDNEPFRMTPIGFLALELWSMSDGIVFDNFVLTDDKKVADDLAEKTWSLKTKSEGSSLSGKSVVDFLMEATEGRPWMWAVYAAVVLLPILGLFKLLKPRNYDPVMEAKKSDAVTSDDAPDDAGQDEDEDADDEAGGDAETEMKKSGKGSLESEDKEESDGETESKTRKRKPRKD